MWFQSLPFFQSPYFNPRIRLYQASRVICGLRSKRKFDLVVVARSPQLKDFRGRHIFREHINGQSAAVSDSLRYDLVFMAPFRGKKASIPMHVTTDMSNYEDMIVTNGDLGVSALRWASALCQGDRVKRFLFLPDGAHTRVDLSALADFIEGVVGEDQRTIYTAGGAFLVPNGEVTHLLAIGSAYLGGEPWNLIKFLNLPVQELDEGIII